jgi:hypothetical protein
VPAWPKAENSLAGPWPWRGASAPRFGHHPQGTHGGAVTGDKRCDEVGHGGGESSRGPRGTCRVR